MRRSRRAGNRERRRRAHDRCSRVRPNRVVLAPGVCAPSLVVVRVAQPGARISHLQGDGGNSASLPGESTTYAVQPLRREGRDVWLHLYAAVQTSHDNSHSGPRVPAGTRSSLRPLSFEGEAMRQSSGEMRREDASPCRSLNDALVPRTLRERHLRCAACRDTERRAAHPCTPSLRAQRSNPESVRGRAVGLLRCARNDEDEAAVRHNFTLTRTQRILRNRHSL